ncbi:MAG: NADPH-dependent FMN reductase, partial [Bacteroidota bacterium]
NSSNSRLLDALPALFPQHHIERYEELDQLPLFIARDDQHPWHPDVLNWRQAVATTDALIISTPEYIHNLPALLKNALEWLASSGELLNKPVLPITFLPNPPRGEKAMQSLIWSLQALNARIVGQLPLYRDDLDFDDQGALIDNEKTELLRTALAESGIT